MNDNMDCITWYKAHASPCETHGISHKTYVDGRCIVRFRADPKKIRIGIRFINACDAYQFMMTERLTGKHVATILDDDVEMGLDRLLEIAEEKKIDGIDIGMGCAYDHPQHVITSCNKRR